MQDFNAIDQAKIKIVATAVGVRAHRKTISYWYVVNQSEYAVATDTTNTETTIAEAAATSVDTDAWLFAYQIGQVDNLALFNLFLVQHRDTAGNVSRYSWVPSANHHYGSQ